MVAATLAISFLVARGTIQPSIEVETDGSMTITVAQGKSLAVKVHLSSQLL